MKKRTREELRVRYREIQERIFNLYYTADEENRELTDEENRERIALFRESEQMIIDLCFG